MRRPKSNCNELRIIVDLSYGGVNAQIVKNSIDGQQVSHTLPTIQHAIDIIQDIEKAWLASIVISRAFRNFWTCPSDWPFLVIKQAQEHFVDMAMSFGAWNSSLFMMSISNFISRALMKRYVQVLIYHDDIIGPGRSYWEALALLHNLGLPVAHHKLVPPSRKFVWLGICLDLNDNTLSIPQIKLNRMWTMMPPVNCQTDAVDHQDDKSNRKGGSSGPSLYVQAP